jgi:hypothetical protein
MSRALELPQPITPTEVESWFRSSAKRGPWPDEKSCEALAYRLERSRAARLSRPLTAIQVKAIQVKAIQVKAIQVKAIQVKRRDLREKGRAFLGALERQIKEVEADIERTGQINPNTAAEEERLLLTPLCELRDVMIRIRADWDNIIPKHNRWHIRANFIAMQAIMLWRYAGKDKFGLDPDSPLVKFVYQALLRVTKEHHERGAIAKALLRMPSIDLMLRPIDGDPVRR